MAEGPRADLWVVDRVTNKTVFREITTDGTSLDNRDDAIAVGVAELLRASLMEVAAPHRAVDKASPKIRELAYAPPGSSASPSKFRLSLGAGVEPGLRGVDSAFVGLVAAGFIIETRELASRHLTSIGIEDGPELVEAAVMKALALESLAQAREEIVATRERAQDERERELLVGDARRAWLIKLAADKSFEMKVIAAPNDRNFFLVLSRDDIGSIQDMKGKNFAINRPGSEDHALTMNVMRSMGLNPSDVNYVTVGLPNVRVQALLANQVHATTTSVATWVTIKDEPGIKILVSQDDFAVDAISGGDAG